MAGAGVALDEAPGFRESLQPRPPDRGEEESVMNWFPIDQQGSGVRSSTRTRLPDARKVALSLRDRKRGREQDVRSQGTLVRRGSLDPAETPDRRSPALLPTENGVTGLVRALVGRRDQATR